MSTMPCGRPRAFVDDPNALYWKRVPGGGSSFR
jgi:hypothetical protein